MNATYGTDRCERLPGDLSPASFQAVGTVTGPYSGTFDEGGTWTEPGARGFYRGVTTNFKIESTLTPSSGTKTADVTIYGTRTIRARFYCTRASTRSPAEGRYTASIVVDPIKESRRTYEDRGIITLQLGTRFPDGYDVRVLRPGAERPLRGGTHAHTDTTAIRTAPAIAATYLRPSESGVENSSLSTPKVAT